MTIDVVGPVSATAAVQRGRPDSCPDLSGTADRLGPGRRPVEVGCDLPEPARVPPEWGRWTGAGRAAVVRLVRAAGLAGADGVVDLRFGLPRQDGAEPDRVLVTGTLVRYRVRVAGPGPDERRNRPPFTAHLDVEATGKALAAGLVPRRVVVVAARAGVHLADGLGSWTDPPVTTASVPTSFGHDHSVDQDAGLVGQLAARAHAALGPVWTTVARRRGPRTVLVGATSCSVEELACSGGERGEVDLRAVVTATGTVLAGEVRAGVPSSEAESGAEPWLAVGLGVR